jgi:large subunit ribosomal protein L18
MSLTKPERRQRIRFRIRKSISGTATKQDYLYLEVTKKIYAQLIDDANGVTILAALQEKKK